LNVGAARDAPDLGTVHPRLGVHVVFLSVSRRDEIYVRVVLECHEGMGVARAHDAAGGKVEGGDGTAASAEDAEADAAAGPPRAKLPGGRTLLSLLVVPDFAADARAMLADLARGADVTFLACDPAWVEEVVRELE
jgi:hypothetical protein